MELLQSKPSPIDNSLRIVNTLEIKNPNHKNTQSSLINHPVLTQNLTINPPSFQKLPSHPLLNKSTILEITPINSQRYDLKLLNNLDKFIQIENSLLNQKAVSPLTLDKKSILTLS